MHTYLWNAPELRRLLSGTSPRNLFGTAAGNTKTGYGGTLFEMSPVAKNRFSYVKLYRFCKSPPECTDGTGTQGSLILDKAGDLYGVTSSGGAHDGGEVYELEASAPRSGWTLHVLYSFCSRYSCADGAFPLVGLTYAGASVGRLYDGDSPLFGTANAWGEYGGGGAYELKPRKKGWSYQVIYNFCARPNCTDGNGPWAPLVEDASGNLYGTTNAGGAQPAAGTVFELSPNGGSWTETVLYNFCSLANCADGENPAVGGLAMSPSGIIYGVTGFGGKTCYTDGPGCGVLFDLVPSGTSWQENVLYTFCSLPKCTDGYHPVATPVLDKDGNIFDTAEEGGNGFNGVRDFGSGVVFEYSGSALQVLHAFCAKPDCRDGSLPNGVFREGSGRIFGTTTLGGKNSNDPDNGSGLIYELKP